MASAEASRSQDRSIVGDFSRSCREEEGRRRGAKKQSCAAVGLLTARVVLHLTGARHAPQKGCLKK